MRTMTIKALKELIANLPDNMPVVAPGSDHSYRTVYMATATTAIYSFGLLSEDHGGDGPPLEKGEKRINVFVIDR